jgi:AraC-like DNA-binding protein
MLREIVGEVTGRASAIPHFPDPVVCDQALARRLLRIHRALEASEDPLEQDVLIVDGLSLLVMRHAGAIGGPRPPLRGGGAIKRARDCLEAHHAEPVRLDDLARIARMSRFHLLRQFDREVGLPPHAYLLQLRIGRAKDLLSRGVPAGQAVTLAFMVLLETLTPEERAVFPLREVFDYEYVEIADMLDLSSSNCRQLFHRAKSRLEERKPRFCADVDAKRPLVERFLRAFGAGSADELTRVLAADVGFWSDGGGKVAAARRPVFGREAVVNMLVGVRRTAPAAGIPLESVRLEVLDVNEEPAMLIRVAGRLDSVYTMTIEDDAITALRVVRNPDKLTYVERQLGASR